MCDLLLEHPSSNAGEAPSRYRAGADRAFDFADVLVLVPGRALVRSLEHGLLERSRRAGLPFVSPTFVTPARLATLVVDPFASDGAGPHAVAELLSETAERLLWRRALEAVFAEDPAAVESVFGRGLTATEDGGTPSHPGRSAIAPPRLEPRAVPALVERLVRLSREVSGACADFARIARLVAEAGAGRPVGHAASVDEVARVMASRLAPSWRTLARLESRFAALAADDGRVRLPREAATVRALSAGAVSVGGFRRAVVLLADPEPLHRAVLRALEARGVRVEVCVHGSFDPGGTELDPEGFPVVEHWSRRPFPERVLPAAAIRCAGTPAEQAEQAVRAIERLAMPRRSDRIAVVAGDGPTRRRLECELVGRGVTLASAVERPFAETRLGQLLLRLERLLDARATGTPSLEAFAAFIRHPDVVSRLGSEGIHDGPDAVSRYRATCASESIDDRVPDALASPRGYEGFERLRRWTVELLDRAVRDGGARTESDGRRASRIPRPAKAWAPVIRGLLERIVGDGAATDDARVVDERERAIRALDEALAELASVPDVCSAESTLAETIAVVLARLGSRVVRDQAGSDGVPILGWLDAGIADEPDLVVVGMNEGVVPESAGGDPLLPDALREALGLPSSRRRVARDAWILDGMLARRAAGRGSITFVVGRQDASGDPLRPSRFLLSTGADGDALARRVLLLTGGPTSGGSGAAGAMVRTPASDGCVAPIRAPLAFPITPAIAEPRIESVSVTGFARYMKCPYLFLLERDPRLRLSGDDEDALELDPLAFGNLMHGALEIWGRREADRREATTDASRIRREVLDALDEHVGRHFGRAVAPAVEVQIELARRRLERFADIQAREADAGWKVAFVELAFHAPKAAPSHEASPRSLLSGDEARAILDARGGGSAEGGDGDADPRGPDRTGHPAIRIGGSPDGRRLFVTGRIDRVDRHADGWHRALDYKTSASGDGPARTHLAGRGGAEKRWWKDLQLPLYRRLLSSIGIDVGSRIGYIVLAPKLAQCRVAMLEVSGALLDASKLDEADARADEIADAILAGEFSPAAGPRGVSCPVRADDPMAAIWGRGFRGIDARLDDDASVDEGGGDAGGDPPAPAPPGDGAREVAS